MTCAAASPSPPSWAVTRSWRCWSASWSAPVPSRGGWWWWRPRAAAARAGCWRSSPRARRQHRAWVLQGQAVAQSAQRPVPALRGRGRGHRHGGRRSGPRWRSCCASGWRAGRRGCARCCPSCSRCCAPRHAGAWAPSPSARAAASGPSPRCWARWAREAEPAVVLLDDCQWADEPTLRSWRAGSRRAAPRRGHVMIVGVLPQRGGGPGHVAAAAQPGAAHLRLAAFGAGGRRALAESMAGALPREAIELVVRLSEGNPFMASAVLHGLVEDGALVPGPRRLAGGPEAMAARALLARRRPPSWCAG